MDFSSRKKRAAVPTKMEFPGYPSFNYPSNYVLSPAPLNLVPAPAEGCCLSPPKANLPSISLNLFNLPSISSQSPP